MVDRVLLGDDGAGNFVFKVSRPSFDVNVAEGAELAFDASFNNQIKVHMKVSFLGNNSVSTYVPFNKTFILPPPVIYMDKQNAYSSLNPNECKSGAAIGRIVDYRSDYNQGLFRVSVTTTGMDIKRDAYTPMSLLILDVEQ
ncbi:hypothetical protein [Maritalea myrionectae]|uniref:hypothetical protein n=1 Tax=Maritalea myrionectae TaxID=454601 RepID=UPI00041EC3F5|nr:hypothetical protein [Maritalea myrionectae]